MRELICLLFLSAMLHSRSKDFVHKVKNIGVWYVFRRKKMSIRVSTKAKLLVSFVFCVLFRLFCCAIAREVKPVLRQQMRRLKMECSKANAMTVCVIVATSAHPINWRTLNAVCLKNFISSAQVVSWTVFTCTSTALCLSVDRDSSVVVRKQVCVSVL